MVFRGLDILQRKMPWRVIYFTICVHLCEYFCSGLKSPTDRKPEMNQISHSDIHEIINIHGERQWEVFLPLIMPAIIIWMQNMDRKYTLSEFMLIFAMCSPHLCHICFVTFKCVVQPSQILPQISNPLQRTSEWVGVHQRTNARWHGFIKMNTESWRGYFAHVVIVPACLPPSCSVFSPGIDPFSCTKCTGTALLLNLWLCYKITPCYITPKFT